MKLALWHQFAGDITSVQWGWIALTCSFTSAYLCIILECPLNISFLLEIAPKQFTTFCHLPSMGVHSLLALLGTNDFTSKCTVHLNCEHVEEALFFFDALCPQERMKGNICEFLRRSKKKDCSQEAFSSDAAMTNAPVNYWVFQNQALKKCLILA